ncbi:MAG TPA: cell division protein FtsA [Fimbriimonadaceae bacterium]|jgi:cell division protein FtsA
MSNPLIAVLDLGSTKAACIAAEQNDDGFNIVAVSSVECKGVRRGVVADLEHTANAIDMAVRKIQQTVGQDIPSLVVSIGGAHIEGINTQGFVPIFPKGREITRDDVLQVMNHSRQVVVPADREQIQALPREFKIDGQGGVARPIGMSGSKLEVTTYLVTGQTSHIQNIEKAVAMAGKRVEMMVLQCLASSLGVLTPQEIELGCVVVDIGGGTTDVAVFSGGSIVHTACLPIGGQLVTSDLSKLLKTSPDEAERLKVESACALPTLVKDSETCEVLQLGQTHSRPMQRRVLCEIVESRMKELAVMVRQQIEKSGMYGVLPAGVVLTGGGSQMDGTEKLFESVLQHLRVRSGAPKLGGELASEIDRPEMSTGIGLVKFALECSEDEFATAAGASNWKERIRTFWSLLSGKA